VTTTCDIARTSAPKAIPADHRFVSNAGRALSATLLQSWKWLSRHSRGVLTRGVSRRLRVAETVSLGEKRFVSIVQVDGEQFLIGGTPANVVLLAKLEAKPETLGSFESVFARAQSDVDRVQPDGEASAEVVQ